MATSRAAKVQAEIDKAKAKLAEQQTRLRELESKKTEIENTEIVDIVRGMSIPLDELATLLQSIRGGALPVSTSGRNVPKLKTTATKETLTESADTDKEADTE